MPESRLFIDVLRLIAEKLYEDSRSHSVDARYALLNLCLTSRTMYQIATPFLYREIKLIGSFLGALCCFQTLLDNDLAAASVKTLRVHGLFDEGYRNLKYGRVRGASTLIPLFSSALHRLDNLTAFYFYPMRDLKAWKKELTELFGSKYPFSLHVLFIELLNTFPAVIDFINRQSDVCDLYVGNLGVEEASSLHLPALQRVTLNSDYTSSAAIQALLLHHPQISHAALGIFRGMLPGELPSMIEDLLTQAINLTSLRLMFKSTEHFATCLDLSNTESVWSSSLRLLRMVVVEEEVDARSILSCIKPILGGKFPNLIAMWFNCAAPPAVDVPLVTPKVDGSAWDFYFESNGRVQLARCDKERDGWIIEEIDQKDIPAVRDRLSRI